MLSGRRSPVASSSKPRPLGPRVGAQALERGRAPSATPGAPPVYDLPGAAARRASAPRAGAKPPSSSPCRPSASANSRSNASSSASRPRQRGEQSERRRASTLLRRGRVGLERRLGRVPAARLQRRLHGEGAAQAVLERPVGACRAAKLEQAERRVPRPPVSDARDLRRLLGTRVVARHAGSSPAWAASRPSWPPGAGDCGLPGVRGDPQARPPRRRARRASAPPAGARRRAPAGRRRARRARRAVRRRRGSGRGALGPVDLAGISSIVTGPATRSARADVAVATSGTSIARHA